MEQAERWKVIVGYHGRYRVSDQGRVQSNVPGYWYDLAQAPQQKHYRKVALYWNGERGDHAVHRLVAEAFIPNPQKKPQVNHIDSNPSNNHVGNLEWMTRSENVRHAVANGKFDHRGEKNGRSLLTADEVRAMRRVYEQGGITQTDVGKMFDMSPFRAHQILRYKQWTHI